MFKKKTKNKFAANYHQLTECNTTATLTATVTCEICYFKHFPVIVVCDVIFTQHN